VTSSFLGTVDTWFDSYVGDERDTEPGVIGQDVSRGLPVVDQPGHHEHRARGWEQRRQNYEAAVAAQQALVGQMVAHLGGIHAAIIAPPVSDVLGQFSAVVPAPPLGTIGGYSRSWKQPYRAVTIANTSPSLVAFTTRALEPSGLPPSLGVGTLLVPAGTERTIVCSGTALSLYGPAGTVVDLTVYSRPKPPTSGPCGIVAQPLAASQAFAAASAGTVTMTPTNPNLTAYLRFAQLNGSDTAGTAVFTITGLAAGTLTFAVSTNAGAGAQNLGPFPEALPASAPGVGISLAVASVLMSNQWSASLAGYQA